MRQESVEVAPSRAQGAGRDDGDTVGGLRPMGESIKIGAKDF